MDRYARPWSRYAFDSMSSSARAPSRWAKRRSSVGAGARIAMSTMDTSMRRSRKSGAAAWVGRESLRPKTWIEAGGATDGHTSVMTAASSVRRTACDPP